MLSTRRQMAERLHFRLVHDEARRRAMQAICDAKDGAVVEIRPDTRSLEQNAKLHALLQEMEGMEWFGRPRNAMEWKVLMVSAHNVATGKGTEVVPGLEGELVNIRESTASMSKGRLSSLIEYITAWRAQHDQ